MRALAIFSLFVLASCASSPQAGRGDTGGSIITKEQIMEMGAPSIYDAVRQLHRQWLPYRQGSYIIVADQNHLIWGRIDANDTRDTMSQDLGLSKFIQKGGADDVYAVESISPTAASGIWAEHVGDRDFLGAIIVWTRPRAGG